MESEKIFEVRTEFAVHQAQNDILANTINAIIAVAIFWPVVDHLVLVIWLFLLVLGGATRLLISNSKTRNFLRLQNPRRWYCLYNPLTAFFGVVWGASGYLFFIPGELGYQLFIAILLVGMVAGSVSSLPVFLPVFYFFLLSLLIPISVLLLSEPHRLAFGMGLLCIVFILYTSIAGWKSHSMITDALSSRFKTEALARLDPLTEIMNRRAMDDTLFLEFGRAKRNSTPITFAICDIDFFKAINDSLGHLAGDAILRKVSSSLRYTLSRPTDYVARYGGEEFAIILPDTPRNGASHIMERVRENVESLQVEHPKSSCSKYITISIGVYTFFPDETCKIEDVINNADIALYKAKTSGRNKVVYFDEISNIS